MRNCKRQVVRDLRVVGFAHSHGRNAEAEKARIVSGKLRRDGRQIVQIFMHDLLNLGVLASGRAPAGDEHFGDVGIEQAFTQRALSDHACRAKQNDLQRFLRIMISSLLREAAARCRSQTLNSGSSRHWRSSETAASRKTDTKPRRRPECPMCCRETRTRDSV